MATVGKKKHLFFYNPEEHDVPIDKETLEYYYNDYVNFNVKQLEGFFVTEYVHPSKMHFKPPEDRAPWDENYPDPYIQATSKDNLALARDIKENGTYWPIKAMKDADGNYYVTEGVHRIEAIQKLIEAGEWEDDRCLYTILLYPHLHPIRLNKLDEPVKLHFPECLIKVHIRLFGDREYTKVSEGILECEHYDMYELLCACLIYPFWLRDMFFEYKKETGEMIQPCEEFCVQKRV